MNDPYIDPDSQAKSTVQAMITRLEERGKHEGFSKMVRDYIDRLDKERPLVVLDLGCGTGPYEDRSFDAITMHTLLSHVADPSSILSEARRVLKEDGRLIVFDADHAGTTYNQPEYEMTRRTDHLLTSAIATHPDICRQLPRLLKGSGYTLTDHSVEVISECGKGDYWLSSVQGFARLMPAIKALSEEEAKSWVDYMLSSHDEGTFFAAGAFYIFYAEADTTVAAR